MVSINQQSVNLKSTASSATAATLNIMYVKVMSIDNAHRIAHVVNQIKATKQVSLTHMVGRGGVPKAGETWMITSAFGPWMFVAQVNPALDVTPSNPADPGDPNPSDPFVPAIVMIKASDAPIDPDNPDAVQYVGDWSNYNDGDSETYGPAGYFLDYSGVLHFFGFIANGGHSDPIFYLPESLRPAYSKMFSVMYSGSYPSAWLEFDPDGSVYFTGNALSTTVDLASLDGVSFLPGT